jgi:hypothetical protein
MMGKKLVRSGARAGLTWRSHTKAWMVLVAGVVFGYLSLSGCVPATVMTSATVRIEVLGQVSNKGGHSDTIFICFIYSWCDIEPL